jgi:hypothetical protein
MEPISIVIQGPLHEHSLSNIEYYKTLGPVIISCYENDRVPDLGAGVTVLQSYRPLVPLHFNGSLDVQVWSTLIGLSAVRTPCFIKTRADEKYDNLKPLIDKIQNSNFKFVSNNIFYKGHVEPLHPSDHLFGGNTFIFKRAFSLLHGIIQHVHRPYLLGQDFGPELGPIGAEVAIFLSFLASHNIAHSVNSNNIHQMTLDHTELVDIDELGPYIWSMSLNGKRMYHSTSDPLYEKYPSLKSKDEYYTTTYTI